MADLFFTGASAEDVWPLIRDHHYSGRMPSNIQHCYVLRKAGGLFGDFGEPIAAAIFCIPPTRWREPVLELARLVRLPDTKAPLTSLIAFSCNHLRKNGHDLLVSFADWSHGHHGGVYQAASWQYCGQRTRSMDGLVVDGHFVPGRSCNSTWGTRSPSRLSEALPEHQIEAHYDEGKHLYWRALTKLGRRRAADMELKSLTYPKPERAAKPEVYPWERGR